MEGGLEGKVYTLNEPTQFDGRGLTGRRNESSIGSVDGELWSPASMKIHVPPYSESHVPIRLVLFTGIRVRTTYLDDRYSIAIYIYAFRSGFWVGVSSFFFFFAFTVDIIAVWPRGFTYIGGRYERGGPEYEKYLGKNWRNGGGGSVENRSNAVEIEREKTRAMAEFETRKDESG